MDVSTMHLNNAIDARFALPAIAKVTATGLYAIEELATASGERLSAHTRMAGSELTLEDFAALRILLRRNGYEPPASWPTVGGA